MLLITTTYETQPPTTTYSNHYPDIISIDDDMREIKHVFKKSPTGFYCSRPGCQTSIEYGLFTDTPSLSEFKKTHKWMVNSACPYSYPSAGVDELIEKYQVEIKKLQKVICYWEKIKNNG